MMKEMDDLLNIRVFYVEVFLSDFGWIYPNFQDNLLGLLN